MRRTLLLLVFLLSLSLGAENLTFREVYIGNPRSYTHPAEIDMDKVFRSHPLYPRLLKYSQREPEYWITLDRINSDIRDALYEVVEKKGLDLVVEKEKGLKFPDITSEVIRELRK